MIVYTIRFPNGLDLDELREQADELAHVLDDLGDNDMADTCLHVLRIMAHASFDPGPCYLRPSDCEPAMTGLHCQCSRCGGVARVTPDAPPGERVFCLNCENEPPRPSDYELHGPGDTTPPKLKPLDYRPPTATGEKSCD